MENKFLIVSLGNPEEKWKSTRHNIGNIKGLRWKRVAARHYNLAKNLNILWLFEIMNLMLEDEVW